MTDARDDRHQRTQVALLGLIAFLLALLVGGMGLGAWALVGEARRLEAAVARQSAAIDRQVDQAVATSKEAAHEVEARQRALTAGLNRQSAATLGRVRELEARRRALASIPASPFGKLDRGIQVSQLSVDELLTLLTHIAETQAVIAREAQPLPVQKKVDRR